MEKQSISVGKMAAQCLEMTKYQEVNPKQRKRRTEETIDPQNLDKANAMTEIG